MKEQINLNGQITAVSGLPVISLSPAERAVAIDNWYPKSSSTSATREIGVIDFFSGCGGMTLGFDALSRLGAPFQILAGIDINKQSLESYATNFGAHAVCQDVSKVSELDEVQFNEFTKMIGLENRPERLVVIGCAPCQGFSAHTKTNMSRVDARNNLVVRFAETAVKLDADVIIMENVPELINGRFSHFYEEFKDVVEEKGYSVTAGIHNAAEFGVPQKRMRALVIASKHELPKFNVSKLTASEQRNVFDAIGDLPEIQAGEICPTDAYHKSARHRPSTIEVIKQIPHDGGSRPSGVGPKCLEKVNGFTDVYGRLSWEKPSITITHYSRNPASGRFVHPTQDRGLTMREAARLQSFPDEFVFSGKNDDVYRQIGEAVPPIMSMAVAEYVLQCLNLIKN